MSTFICAVCLPISGTACFPYSDLCVQHPEFENLAYSIYCSVYVSEHTHDAVLQLGGSSARTGFSLRIYAGKRIHLHAADFPLRQRKTTPYRKLFYGFYCTAKRIYILYIENIFPVTTDWKPYYTRCLHLLTERYFSRNPISVSAIPIRKDPDFPRNS